MSKIIKKNNVVHIIDNTPKLYGTAKYNNSNENSLYGKILNSSQKTHQKDVRATNAHETTHYANSQYSNKNEKFFLVEDKLLKLTNIEFPLEKVAKSVPSSFRTKRYNLYLKEQQKYFANNPLYVFDEWTSYINGAAVALEDNLNNKHDEYNVDRMIPIIEFSIYSLCLTEIVRREYPLFYKEYKKFTYYCLKKSEDIYKKGMQIPNLKWDNDLIEKIRKDSQFWEIRSILKNEYDSIWLQ